ncbi:the MIZ type in Nse subunit zinc-finger protein [Toxoplasma gondii GAB2-2007-GAL-DOM2]|uniref:SP-RING-type domain-containing protein n=7 Tax=Toxoplasma gondii TaxID=5811 RepID=S7VQI5_TOXGG|nr:hypothetical protein TGGT1_305760 [Toxoplasma gondii GT1]KAF4644737.1 hypothetical protein TGRH88_017310 [Toxoplasma gondii]KFG33416.1 the MIZ type in Nse subunit zinc-finger protein [Toxoplasma gondii GAB2-2007-GAL-DOM2]KFG45098.1 the MIZ type in Nse subunit zinc-finger protein [Toxoplasma gondii FOU]RQX67921.1 the MIZ type in Nse subunit zinc-finger protein [Toxoplasma gondii CAST]
MTTGENEETSEELAAAVAHAAEDEGGCSRETLAEVEELGPQLQTELNRARDFLQRTLRRMAVYATRALPALSADASTRQQEERRGERKRLREREAAAIASAVHTAEELWRSEREIFAPFLEKQTEAGEADDEEPDAGVVARVQRRLKRARSRKTQAPETETERRFLLNRPLPAAKLENDPCFNMIQRICGDRPADCSAVDDVELRESDGEESEEDAGADAERKRFLKVPLVFFRCPITQEKFTEPVSTRFAPDGEACVHVFEKEAILAALRRSNAPGSVACPFAGCRATIRAASLQEDVETKLRMQHDAVKEAQEALDREPSAVALLDAPAEES